MELRQEGRGGVEWGDSKADKGKGNEGRKLGRGKGQAMVERKRGSEGK